MEVPPPPFHALLVGIDSYLNPLIPRLQGCKNDVELMARLLQDRFGADPDNNIHTLRDKHATHQGIRDAFYRYLVTPARAWAEAGTQESAPVFLYYFSGHGSQALKSKRPGDLAETTVPYDSRMGDVFDIYDFELGEWLDELAQYSQQNVNVILDCCHSGSGTRGESAPDTAEVSKVRFCQADDRIPPWADEGEEPHRGIKAHPENHVVLSACQNYQKARQYRTETGDCYGALTYALVGELGKMSRPLSYAEVLANLHSHLWRGVLGQQKPVCYGDKTRMMLSEARALIDLWLRVREVHDDGTFIIDGGHAHGLENGAVLGVYPAGTRHTSEAEPIATLQVHAAGSLQSYAAVLNGNAADLGPDLPVKILRRARLRPVWLDVQDDRLRADLEKYFAQVDFSGEMEPVYSTEQAALVLHQNGDTLELRDTRGHTLLPAEPKSRAYALLQKVQHVARYINKLERCNPHRDSFFHGKLRVRLLLDGKETRRIPAGRDFEVEVENLSASRLHVAIFDFQENWAILRVHSVNLESDTRDAFTVTAELKSPDAYSATSLLKVMAGTEPSAFDDMPQGEVAQAARGGHRTRGPGGPAQDEWTTVELAYQVVH